MTFALPREGLRGQDHRDSDAIEELLVNGVDREVVEQVSVKDFLNPDIRLGWLQPPACSKTVAHSLAC